MDERVVLEPVLQEAIAGPFRRKLIGPQALPDDMAEPDQEPGTHFVSVPATLLDVLPEAVLEFGFEVPPQAQVYSRLDNRGERILVPQVGQVGVVRFHLAQQQPAAREAPHALADAIPAAVPGAGLRAVLQVVPDAVLTIRGKARIA